MKQIWNIFKRDVRRLCKNRFALIVTIGIIVIPSLYAWFNIGANYDPYSNTRNLKVAVASEDAGTSNAVTGRLNAGDEIVANLRENDQLGWTFVDTGEAVEGVKSGKYYAAIIIPEDFSARLTEFLNGRIEKSEIIYYVNEKKNAIAPKITDTGAQTLEEEIKNTFSAVASESVSKAITASAAGISGKLNQASADITTAIDTTRSDLDTYRVLLKNFRGTIAQGQSSIDGGRSTLDSLKDAAASGQKGLESAQARLSQSRESIGTFSGSLSGILNQGHSVLGQINGTAASQLGNLEAQALEINAGFESGITSAKEMLDVNQEIVDALKKLNEDHPSAELSRLIQSLEAEAENQQKILDRLEAGNTSVKNMIAQTSESRKNLNQITSDGGEALNGVNTRFQQTLLPQINQSLDSFALLSGKTSGILSGVTPAANQLQGILDDLGTALTEAGNALDSTQGVLADLTGQLSRIATDLNAIKNSRLYQNFLSTTGIQPEQVADFMASPVEVETEKIYPVANYGSALAPFYSNLAIWVGGIVLIAIFKLEVDEDESIKNLTPTRAYFGRWLLYITVGLLQGLVVCAGDLLLMKIQCESPGAFIFAGLLASFVYVNLIYALSVTFKHIGKAICVILVILQIPGSAGTYPIEMTPGFFQAVHPLLPFTYGINAMREAVAGVYAAHYASDLLHLLLFVPVALVIGLGLRPLLLNLNHFFDRRLSETGLMVSETEGGIERKKDPISIIARALALEGRTAAEREARQAAFEESYRKKIKAGFLLMFILPLVFMVLMFSLDSKIIYLVLWIISLIGISVYLICLEYFRDKMRKQFEIEQQLCGMTDEEIRAMFKDDWKGTEK
ncbi:YhgE/Pip domain-containing protein [Eubacterium sp. 1001713B170207_170306_E7]|uniref:YhgE/Pip family protein n=1 Tax=Eubacterium sp. 1001713B170207_170306_E7 TaxID=2787097 RepID=UPI00189B8D46